MLNWVTLLLLFTGYYSVPFIFGILIDFSQLLVDWEGYLLSYMLHSIVISFVLLVGIVSLYLDFVGHMILIFCEYLRQMYHFIFDQCSVGSILYFVMAVAHFAILFIIFVLVFGKLCTLILYKMW